MTLQTGDVMSIWLAVLIGFGVPLLIWLLVFAAARQRLFNLKSMLRALSILRWLALVVATLFLIGWLANSAPSSTVYKHLFFCVFLFSTNLFLPQQWLQKQLRNETSGGVESSA
jgi:hypothetical protein